MIIRSLVAAGSADLSLTIAATGTVDKMAHFLCATGRRRPGNGRSNCEMMLLKLVKKWMFMNVSSGTRCLSNSQTLAQADK